VTALLGGCATMTSDSYCELSDPIYFSSENTVEFLEQNDVSVLRDIVTHNEVWSEICGSR
jgi:hypothetical protein